MEYFKMEKAEEKRPANKELQKMIADYNYLTKEISDELAIEMLAVGKNSGYQTLLDIAAGAHDGPAKAVLIAFKLGLLKSRASCWQCEYGQDIQSLISEVSLKLQKAAAALLVTIGTYNTGAAVPVQGGKEPMNCSASDISNILRIVYDYIYDAKEEMEGGILI